MITKSVQSILLLFAMIVSSLAYAGPVQEAQDLVDEAEYSQAAKVMRKALASGQLSKNELIQLYQVQATVYIALGNRARAEAAFRNLILAEPGFEMPSGVSPKVRAAFAEVKQNLLHSGALDQAYKPSLDPIASVPGNKDVPLSLHLGARASEIKRVQIFYRRVGSPHYASIDANLDKPGSWKAAIPGFFVDKEREDYAVEYYAEASDADQRRLTGVGLPTMPLTFEVLGNDNALSNGREDDDGQSIPVATIAIAAGAVVAVAVLAGVGLYFLLNQQGEGSANIHIVKAGS